MRNRQSIRLQSYDYSKAGMYFITICTYNDEKLFGRIIDGIMILNDSGILAHDEWYKLRDRYNVKLHEFVVMPNHIHGIIEIIGNLNKGGIDEGVINNASTRFISIYLQMNILSPTRKKPIHHHCLNNHFVS